MHVLLLDPDPDFRAYVAALLRYAGYSVTDASTAASPTAREAASCSDLLVLRLEASDTHSGALRRLARARNGRPTLALSLGLAPESVADSLCLPVRHCFTLPLLSAAFRLVLQGLADSGAASIE